MDPRDPIRVMIAEDDEGIRETLASIVRAEKAFDLMVAMPLSLVSTSDLLPEAWRLRHHITVSDACYVVLARRLGATLVTGDKRLARTHQLRVPTLSPSDDR